MRICSIITSFTAGGAEVLAANLTSAFVKAGHGSTMLALCDAAAVGNSEAYEQALKQSIRSSGGEACSLKLVNRRNLLAGAMAMRKAIINIDPDIIHVHTAQALLMLLLAGVRRPIVYTHHNIRCNFPLWLFRAFDRVVDRYIAIGEACHDLLEGAVRKPIILIRNGVPANFSVAAPRIKLARDPVIFAAGALTPQKDYGTLIRAFSHVIRKLTATGRRPRLRIAGGGSLMERLQALVKELGLAESVELLGTRSDVPELMRQSDLMVNSSEFEGLPIALIEAVMSALPIVATDVGGNSELVEPNVNGLLTPAGDPEALSQAVLSVLEDEGRYVSMSLASSEKSRAFTLENCARAHLKLYADISRKPAWAESLPTVKPLPIPDRGIHQKYSSRI